MLGKRFGVCLALAALSLVFPWALVALGLSLLYVGHYCVMSSLEAQLDVFADRPETASWTQRLRWRAVIAWLHFLEPLARDWGRLKGGLTPWRSALETEADAHDTDTSTRWWQRINPFVRHVQWQGPFHPAYRVHPAFDLLGVEGAAMALSQLEEFIPTGSSAVPSWTELADRILMPGQAKLPSGLDPLGLRDALAQGLQAVSSLPLGPGTRAPYSTANT